MATLDDFAQQLADERRAHEQQIADLQKAAKSLEAVAANVQWKLAQLVPTSPVAPATPAPAVNTATPPPPAAPTASAVTPKFPIKFKLW